RTVIAVMVLGFSGLIAITFMAYRNAPPIPERVVDEQASTVFTREDILEGQTVFLKYGLMANGSIWGHGAYLGPDYSAQALHRLGELTADDVARKRFGMPFAALTKPQQAGIAGEAAALLKVNRHDDATQTLRFSAPEVVAYREQIIHWTDYFRDPSRNGGLKA